MKVAAKMWRPLVCCLATMGGVTLAISMVLAETLESQPRDGRPSPSIDGAVAASSSGQARGSDGSARPSRAANMPPLHADPDNHPLTPVLRWAKEGLPTIENLTDYSATLARRERIHGKLSNYEYVFVKIRHKPFSVYAYFSWPAALKGQEVIYVAGQNQGNLLAHRARVPVKVALNPNGMIAMAGRNYPLTEIGLVNLVHRLVEVGQQDIRYGECEVKYFTAAKLNKRVCTVIEVVHPVPRDVFRFHVARIFVDDELKMPIRYESYDWPSEPGGEPELIEEYSYLDLKVNNGFTDLDFSTSNPDYHFPQGTKKPEAGDEGK